VYTYRQQDKDTSNRISELLSESSAAATKCEQLTTALAAASFSTKVCINDAMFNSAHNRVPGNINYCLCTRGMTASETYVAACAQQSTTLQTAQLHAGSVSATLYRVMTHTAMRG
jgi:hypothetical protein